PANLVRLGARPIDGSAESLARRCGERVADRTRSATAHARRAAMPSGRDGRPDARLLDARTAQPTARPTPARAARESTSSRSAPPKALANPSRRAARSAPGRAACTARKTQVDDESATTTSRAASPDGHSASRGRRVKRLGDGAAGTPRWSPTTGPDGQMYVTDGTRSQASSSPRRAHHPPEPKILRAARSSGDPRTTTWSLPPAAP